jgi:hypothetical protein
MRERLILHASYPKTGSTLLADLLRRVDMNHDEISVEQFTFLKNKNNFRVRANAHRQTLILKTHFTFGDWRRASWKAREQRPAELSFLEQHLPFHEDVFDNPNVEFVYVVRNPFNVLLSAIRYAKVMLREPETLEAWQSDGRAHQFFVELLGYEEIPEIQQFDRFETLELPELDLERLCWRFLRSGGSIPVFDYEGAATYFQHVNYYCELFRQQIAAGKILEYENLRAGQHHSLTMLADAWQLDLPILEQGLEEVLRIAKEKSRRPLGFYGDMTLGTPRQIKNLSSWPEMQQHVATTCPRLASLCG